MCFCVSRALVGTFKKVGRSFKHPSGNPLSAKVNGLKSQKGPFCVTFLQYYQVSVETIRPFWPELKKRYTLASKFARFLIFLELVNSSIVRTIELFVLGKFFYQGKEVSRQYFTNGTIIQKSSGSLENLLLDR